MRYRARPCGYNISYLPRDTGNCLSGQYPFGHCRIGIYPLGELLPRTFPLCTIFQDNFVRKGNCPMGFWPEGKWSYTHVSHVCISFHWIDHFASSSTENITNSSYHFFCFTCVTWSTASMHTKQRTRIQIRFIIRDTAWGVVAWCYLDLTVIATFLHMQAHTQRISWFSKIHAIKLITPAEVY